MVDGVGGTNSNSIVGAESFVFSAMSSMPVTAISGVVSPGDLIHTASTLFKDELWMYASNSGVPDRILTLEFGDTTTTDQVILTIPGRTFLTPILPGMVLGDGLELTAFADEADAVTIMGNVNQW